MRACDELGKPGLSRALERLERPVAALSGLFTLARPAVFPDYTAELQTRLAYGLFWFPQSFVRTQLPLAEIVEFRRWQPGEGEPLRLLDLGCGLGAAGLGAADWLLRSGTAKTVKLTALDSSPRALEWLDELTREQARRELPGLSVRTRQGDLRHWPESSRAGTYELIVLGFSLNEAYAGSGANDRLEFLATLRSLLAPGGLLLVLEPALRESAEALQAAADTLVLEGTYRRWGPGLHQGADPTLREGHYHPHEVRAWELPRTVEFLNRRLHRSLGELTFHYAALGTGDPPELPAGPRLARLVSPMALLKRRFACEGVDAAGTRHSYDISARGLAKRAAKDYAAGFERGDILQVAPEALEAAGTANTWRINEPGAVEAAYHVA